MKTRASGVAVLAVMLVAAVLYVRVGWWRMEDDCTADRYLVRHGGEVTYAWSWRPTGFRCTYADGHVRSSLMF